jgi:hypothetical protein
MVVAIHAYKMTAMNNEVLRRRFAGNILNVIFAAYPFWVTTALYQVGYPGNRLVGLLSCIGLAALQLGMSFRRQGAFGTLAMGLEVRSAGGGAPSFRQWLVRSAPFLAGMGCLLAEILVGPKGGLYFFVGGAYWLVIAVIVGNAASLFFTHSGRTFIDQLSCTEMVRPEWHRLPKPPS